MKNNNEFDHIITNAKRVLKLSAQYEIHTYVQEFTKEFHVVFIYKIYVLEGEVNANFDLNKAWDLLQDAVDPLSSDANVFRRQMLNCMTLIMHLETM